MASGGRIRLVPEYGSPLTLLVAAPPERSGGVGGWVASERALRRPAKWFRGLPDDTISWDLILDIDAIGGPPIERRLRVLRDMGQPGSGHEEPPSIRIEGDIWEGDTGLSWVIDGLSFGDRLWNADGTLRRQHVQVQMSRYAPVDEVEAIRITATRRGTRARRRTVRAKGYDTLRAIALRELGDGSRWKDLKRWNKKLAKVNPDSRLRTGTAIVIHPGTPKASKPAKGKRG